MVRYNPIVKNSSIAGISVSDGCNSTLRALDIMDCVIHHLQRRNIFVIFNNHNSWAAWVGAGAAKHSQGLWNLPGYSTKDWISSMETLIRRYKVTGIDFRNEIHDQDGIRITWGESEDVNSDWLAATSKAYDRIYRIDPDILAIVGGLCWNTDLRAMTKNVGPVRAFNNKKLVYTVHIYTFTYWWTVGGDIITRYITPISFFSGLFLMIVSVVMISRIYQKNLLIQSQMKFYFQMGQIHEIIYMGMDSVVYQTIAASFWFHISWLIVAVSFTNAASSAGCHPLAVDANWLVIASSVWTVLSFLSVCCSCCCTSNRIFTSMYVALSILWIGIFFLSVYVVCFYLSTERAYQDYFKIWSLDNRPVPVWVGEFGTGNPYESKFKTIWDFIHERYDLDFAYWAFNGRKWNGKKWESESFGLLNDAYDAWRIPPFVDILFKL
jgi:hypothetical protein